MCDDSLGSGSRLRSADVADDAGGEPSHLRTRNLCRAYLAKKFRLPLPQTRCPNSGIVLPSGDAAGPLFQSGVTGGCVALEADGKVASRVEDRRFREDINGLRALAIIPVVAFHASIPGFSGGFIGVDVFFVISGYLITTQLLTRVRLTGKVGLAVFWAKRLRRLAPALVLMSLVTTAVAILVLSPLSWSRLGLQCVASALYVSNLLFAYEGRSYFAPDLTDSPFLHTWTLGVEEQFYVFWPLLICAILVVSARRRIPLQGLLVASIVATLIASFAMALDESIRRSLTFYILPTRAWEFAVGGLVALLPLHRWLVGKSAAGNLMTVAGIAALTLGTSIITPQDRFPGWATVVPVAGSALIIVGGSALSNKAQAPPLVSQLLAIRPLQWIGSVSYSWYLWHWPFIVLTIAAVGDDPLWLQVVAAGSSLVVAAVAFYTVERPLRHSSFLQKSPKRTFSVAGASIVTTVLMGGSVFLVATHLERTTLSHYAAVRAAVPGDNSCMASAERSSNGIQYCVYGDTQSTRLVLLVGDSHAGQWRDALAAAARAQGVRLVTRWRTSCPAISIRVTRESSAPDPGCSKYQAETIALMQTLSPRGVIISQAGFYGPRIRDDRGEQPRSAERRLALWARAYRQFIGQASATGAKVAVIEDNPRLPRDPLDCLARFGNTDSDCAPSRAESVEEIAAIQSAEDPILADPEVVDVFNTVETICGYLRCSLTDHQGNIIFRDRDHLSLEWTLSQRPRLELMLASVVRP